MPIEGNPLRTRLFLGRSAVLALGLVVLAGGPGPATAQDPVLPTVQTLEAALAGLRPDYAAYIGGLRSIDPDPGRGIYMALVQPGATDPRARGSAPLAGPGARNDIVFDARAVTDGHTGAFLLLLLDHEYFHARHLAGTTTVPLPETPGMEIQRRYNEAAAWGFNIAEARDGRYPGLREDEFREALDRFRDHYTALRRLVEGTDGEAWRAMAGALQRPGLVTDGPWLSEARWRPSGPGRSTGTP
jgi:hypothetical protein